MERIASQLKISASELAVLPTHEISAATGHGVAELLPAAMQLYDVWNKRLTTSRLNTWREKVSSQLGDVRWVLAGLICLPAGKLVWHCLACWHANAMASLSRYVLMCLHGDFCSIRYKLVAP